MLDKIKGLISSLTERRKKIVKNSFYAAIDNFFNLLIAFFVGLWVARYLGPADYGLYQYVLAFVGFFIPLYRIGIDTLAVRDMVRNNKKTNDILGTAFILKFIGGIIAIVLAMIVIFLLNPGEKVVQLAVFILSIGTLFSMFDVIEFLFKAHLNLRYSFIANLIARLLVGAIKVIFILINSTVIYFIAANALAPLFSVIGFIIIYKLKKNKVLSWKFNRSKAKEFIKEGWPVMLSGFVVYIYSKIDMVMLGKMLADTSQLGFYSAAVKISELFYFLPAAIGITALPVLTAMKKNNLKKYKAAMQVYFDMMLILWLVVAIPVSIFSVEIAGILYGKEYLFSGILLSAYIWSQFGINFNISRITYLTIEYKLKWLLYAGILASIINIGLNIWFIPRYGAIGATITTIITYFFASILVNFLFKDLRNVGKMILSSFNLIRMPKRWIDFYKGINKS